jgi:hypothetical protein
MQRIEGKTPIRSILLNPKKERIVPKAAHVSGDPLLARSDRAHHLLARLNGLGTDRWRLE